MKELKKKNSDTSVFDIRTTHIDDIGYRHSYDTLKDTCPVFYIDTRIVPEGHILYRHSYTSTLVLYLEDIFYIDTRIVPGGYVSVKCPIQKVFVSKNIC